MSRYAPPGGAGGGFRIGPTRTPLIVKQVMLLMGGVFLMQVVLQRIGFSQVIDLGALTGSRFWRGIDSSLGGNGLDCGDASFDKREVL